MNTNSSFSLAARALFGVLLSVCAIGSTMLASGPQCSLPGVQLQTNPPNQQVGNQAGLNQQLDFLGLYAAELGSETNTLTLTMKVETLSNPPMQNGIWIVYMNVKDTLGTARTIFFEMDTTDNPTGAVNFNYGYTDPTQGDISQCVGGCPAIVSGSFATDGTILIKVHTTAATGFSDLSGAHVFDVNLAPVGTQLTSINGQTQLLIGAAGNGQTETIDSAAVPGTYTTLGNASCPAAPGGSASPPPAKIDVGAATGYENFEAPGLLTQGTALSSGVVTVEYMGRGGGEPSIGVNWKSTSNSVGGMTNFQSDLETDFISWNESGSPTIPKATWLNRRAPTSLMIDSDPIGFTDRQTGRVFAGELTLLSPDTCKTSYSDDDGVTWVPSQGSGLASAVDHETIGGGIYHAPIPSGVSPVYPNAVYYCSQEGEPASGPPAFCSRSDDGGLTFGPSIMIEGVNTCSGLHGHVKVSPADGTVYVPFRQCGGNQTAVIVSQDNGITWNIRPVQTASVIKTASSDDPAVAIDNNGRVYILFADGGTLAAVATSDDFGQSWQNLAEVGSAFGIQNVAFPAATAGDAGRAAVAFYGSTTGPEGGNSSADNFNGVWHLYVAHTYDGGASWTTTDVTPKLPIQRMGLLRGGGSPMDRNLLDFFDIAIDRDGRVQVGYVNGCSGGPCSQAPVNADGSTSVTGNAYTATASIARQSSGRRMIAAKDPSRSTSVPGMPFVTEIRSGNLVSLAWNEADTGNSPIQKYEILRGTDPNSEVLLTTLKGAQTSYTDTTATDATKTYYYKVVAVNAVGSSCANNEIAAPFNGDTCSGLVIHRNLPTHPESTGGMVSPPPLPEYLIDYIAVGEPPSTNELMFKMKVGELTTLPPNSRWRMVWNSVASPNEQFYVGMTTDNSVPTPNVTFEYGTVSTLSAVVIGVPSENPLGAADAGSNYDPDGTITIYIDKSKVGSPQPGDLLGAVNGRTFNTGDTPPETFQRSALLIDHTFVKGNVDNSYPPATYTVIGNTICSSGNIEPVSAVSRKKQGSAGNFDVDLPLIGQPGIEDRSGGTSGNYQVIATFTVPVKVQQVTATPGAGGTASVTGFSVHHSQVTVNLANVSDAQTFTVNLIGVSGGSRSGNVAIPMSVLIGDANGDGVVNSEDVSEVQSQSGNKVVPGNFRDDVNADGTINNTDVILTQSKSGTSLP